MRSSLKVISRCRPNDKYLLVTATKSEFDGFTAMVGDGINDAPALMKADVGFCMQSGSNVSMQSSDIIVVTNNFGPIVNAFIWGRNVFENIQSFIKFQITGALTVLVLLFFCTVVGNELIFSNP